MRIQKLEDLLPTRNQLLVERRKAQAKTAGGIFIPEIVSEKEKDVVGRVLAVGPEVMDDRIRVGTNVMYTMFCGLDLVINDKDYKLISEIDVSAIVAE